MRLRILSPAHKISTVIEKLQYIQHKHLNFLDNKRKNTLGYDDRHKLALKKGRQNGLQ